MMSKENNQIKIGVILSYFNVALTALIAISFTPILLRMLGQSEFGIYSIAYAAIGLFAIFDLGLGNANTRYTAKFRVEGNLKQEKILHGNSLLLYTSIGFCVLILGLVFCMNVPKIFENSLTVNEASRLKLMMQFIVVSFSLSFPLSIFRFIVMGYERFIFAKTIELLRIILIPLSSLILLLYGYKSIELIILISVINVLLHLVNVLYCIIYLKIGFDFNFDKKFMKELFFYSFFVFLGTMSLQVNNNVNQFILGIVSGVIPVAIYALGFNLVINFQTLAFAISVVFIPTLTKIGISDDAKRIFNNYFVSIGRLQFYVIALFYFAFLVFGRVFILLWVGPEYEKSYWVCLIALTPLSLYLIQTIGITILQAENKHRFSSLLFTVMVIFNIVLSTFLSKYYDAIGSAISIAVTWFIGHFIILNIYYYKKIHLDIFRFWKEILKILPSLILPISFGVTYLWLLHNQTWISLGMGIMIFTILYLISIILFSFNEFEKKLIIRPLMNKIKFLKSK